jgi:GNAT superfamily N-acetyltransferase
MAIIRTADSRDAAAISFVHVSSWRTTYGGIVPDAYLDSLNVETRTLRWQEQFAAKQSIISVAEDEAGIFGFITGGKIRQPIADYDGELYAMYLLRERQGQGIGRALFQSLAGALLSQGFTGMIVWVLEQNPAVGFYRRMGGVQVAEQKIEIGGAQLDEIAFGFSSLQDCSDRFA